MVSIFLLNVITSAYIVIMYISVFVIGFYPLTFLTPRQQELQRKKPKSYLGKLTFWSTMQVTLLQLAHDSQSCHVTMVIITRSGL